MLTSPEARWRGADESIRAYEIKRGNGQFDAGKIRSITRDLKCIQVLLKSYAELSSLKPTAAESKIISSSIPIAKF